ncbi:tenascin-r isoform x1 [Lasius niger]|uniref:Tenascin-r isoform x1 n=1 Tax=Lasius niger TaxID=67767 RepID=A0A0J7K2Y9_LASNI|nr:tenascin-r isoform x1 [Lasius niger]
MRDCSEKTVKCIDRCDFLCTDSSARCLNGVCVTKKDYPEIPCDETKGGLVVLVKDRGGIRHWSCVCTDPTFYKGVDCSERAADVCEGGIFYYFARNHYFCHCLTPMEMIEVNRKPYCVHPSQLRFFRKDDN